MTQPNHHRIQRQVIELGLAAGMPGPQAQEALAIEMRDRAMPALAAVFDAVAGPHELLRLDRLEIDLGTIAGSDWAPDFRERLVTQMTRELARFRPEVMRGSQSAANGAQPADTMRQFLFFLAHGRLPWWAVRPEGGFSAELRAQRASIEWKAVRAAVFGDGCARQRLIDCLDDELLEDAIARWAGLPHACGALRALTQASLTHDDAQKWRRQFWRTLIDWVLGEGFQSGRERELVGALFAVRRQYSGASRVQPAESLPGESPREWNEPLASGLLSPWREWLTPPPGSSPPVAAPEAGRVSESLLARLPTPLRPRFPAAKRATPEGEGAAIYLPCAGVVLLHPFLETLFRERGLLEGREFRDAIARERAVHLIGLLSVGTAEIPEYDLVLAKLLCAHPIDEPVTPVTLDAADIEASDALLRAVLGHWTALRSASAPWLRTQFFLRDGKLESVDGGFRLTVERRAQDVLLARLPWGFGVIGLPWMKERIFVHWLD